MMNLRSFVICLVLWLSALNANCQDYFAYGGSNYGGINQVYCNPAALADNRLQLDVLLTGFDFNFNNSWFSVKRPALKYSGSLRQASTVKFPLSWQNFTPNVPDNLFKNFNFIASNHNKGLVLENRILLPSVMYQINLKNTVAFSWSVRQMTSISGISPQVANLFEKEFDLNVTQNNVIVNKNFSALQMAWAEYGITCARVIRDKDKHFIKAGVTPKVLQGLESAYFVIKDLDFLFSTTGSGSYFNANFSYAHSANLNPVNPDNGLVSQYYHYVAKPSLGLDLGIVYEWRPKFQNYKYKPDGKNLVWRKDLNKYKLRAGASIMDVGKISYKKQGTYYDVNANIPYSRFIELTDLKTYARFDSVIRKDYNNAQSDKYAIYLPTAINTQLDYAINRYFYLNLSTHLTNLNKKNLYKLSNYTAICFAPRFEHYWLDVSVPFTYNTMSGARKQYLATGLNLRVGPVSFGSYDVNPLFKGDIASFNFYALLKVSIPYKKIKDRDGDGVVDKKDECPDDAGEFDLKGCPDKDKDKVPDKVDACPNQPGLVAFKGCPDTDGDGITDGEDACPKDKGTAYFKGCPDTDGDSIVDKDDACPYVKGIKKFKGCPDTDKDGIQDKDDLCPTEKGPAKYKGCPDTDGDQLHDGIDECRDVPGPLENKGCPWPDTDKDGVLDKVDSCLTVPGVPQYKGCPEPLQLAVDEKKIIEKAYSNLEFATGKDIIKPVSFPSLKALANLMLNHETEWKIVLSGHTDNTGSEEKNMVLSEKRAKAVKNYLIKQGLPEENIVVEWFGQSNNIADNATKEGRQKNRRVEMKVLMKER
ncbi:MAG: OmpA family protein [Bacteroidia bacterium]|nr:OmpA family protein [Bacteroidia bacterium]